MEKLINANAFKWLRKRILNRVYNDINSGKHNFCCHAVAFSPYGFIACWKNLKEVQENKHSHLVRIKENYNCHNVWFNSRVDRLAFIKECLNKLT